MRSLISAVVILALSATTASAIKPKDLIGEWKGRHQETVNGQGVNYKTDTTGEKLPNGSIRLTERARFETFVARYSFQKNGKFTAKVTSGFQILSSYSGTWKQKGGDIVISAKGTKGRLSAIMSGNKKEFKIRGNASKIKIFIKGNR